MRITLEPQQERRDGQSLGEQIVRISKEKGPFLNLTEEKLRIEAETEAEAAAQGCSPATGPSENEDVNMAEMSPQERLGDRKILADAVKTALNEAALSLDCVSLLMSGLRPQAGAASMSPMLKSQVPLGSLSSDTIAEPFYSNDTSAGAGWTMLALVDATRRLNRAAERLRTEASREHTFWSDVLEIVAGGEIVKPLHGTREDNGDISKASLALDYRFTDSRATLDKSASQGLLYRGADGHPVFAPAHEINAKIVRVRVYNGDGQLTGVASLKLAFEGALADVERARALLVEQVLFDSLQVETRALGAYHVHMRDGNVVAELFDMNLEIDMVPDASDSDVPDLSAEDSNGLTEKGQASAHSICCALHLLLLRYHRAQLAREHDIPAPLQSDASSPARPALLTPILSHMQHNLAVRRALQLLKLMMPSSTPKLIPETSLTVKHPDPLHNLLEHPVSRYKIDGPRSLELSISSPLRPGPLYQGKLLDSKPATSAKFSDLTELELWLKWITGPESPKS